MFKVRTEPVSKGTEPYNWSTYYLYQCTWYAYYRALECGFTPPCYWDRSTATPGYTHAKEWLANFREPWEVKDPSWKPQAGDIAVYDGECGHVIFCETEVMTSEYRSGDPNSFRVAKVGDYKAKLLGYLHYPYDTVQPVERNEYVNQIETTDSSLRIRNNPSLQADIIGHVQLGYYNVLSQTEADGYTWYEIEKGKYCANITTDYLPAKGTDIIEEIERYFRMMQDNVKQLTDERDKYRNIVSEVHKLTDVTD